MKRPAFWGSLAVLLVAVVPSQAQFYQQTNLVSSVPNLAANTDPQLKNPWGISFSPTSPFWVSDEKTGVSTLYNSAGVKQGLEVTVIGGHPTGQVFNPTSDFQLSSGGKALFLFATLDGTVAGWNGAQSTTAIRLIDRSGAGAVYTGLALANNGSGNFLYAANSSQGKIDVYDGAFAGTTLTGNFTDPNLPAGFTPYNIQNIGGTLYVTYENENTGGGIVDAFDANGNLIRRVTSNGNGGVLDSPWGLAIAPASFGPFGGALLVGNEDDGKINAFDPLTGTFLGALSDQFAQPLINEGLWGLTFGNGGNGGSPDTLYFAAGINGERDGLLGAISFVNAPVSVPEPGAIASLMALLTVSSVLMRRRVKQDSAR